MTHASGQVSTPVPTGLLSLPSDILRKIFRHTMPVHDDPHCETVIEAINVHDNTRDLVKLCAISHALREAVRDDGLLWTNIHCDMEIDLVKLYLQLSHPLLVSVHFFGISFDRDLMKDWRTWRIPGSDDISKVVRRNVIPTATSILMHASRIGRLSFCFPDNPVILDELVSVFDTLRPVFTNLDTLSFRHFSKDSGSTKLKSLIRSAPKTLQVLNLYDVEDNLLSLISWRLRRLDLSTQGSSASTDDFRQVLTHLALTLEEFAYETDFQPVPFSDGPQVQMPRLRRLKIEGPKIAYTMSFLAKLDFTLSPNVQIQLQTVKMEGDDWVLVAQYLNRQYRRYPSVMFAFTYLARFFALEVMDSEGGFSVQHKTYNFDNHDSGVTSMAYVAIENLVCTTSDDLLARVVDLHICEDYESWRISASLKPESLLPWTAVIHHFQNIASFTINAGTEAVSYSHVSLSASDFETDTYYEQYMHAARPIHSTVLNMLSSKVETEIELFPLLQTLKFEGHRLLDSHETGEKTLLAVIERRSHVKPICKLILNHQCAISASFRREVSRISPTTVVEMEGEIVPVALEEEDWIRRGSWIVRMSLNEWNHRPRNANEYSGPSLLYTD